MTRSSEEVLNGIINYLDHEVMGKLPVSGQWIMGTAVGLAHNKARNIVEALKNNTVVTMLDIVDEDGNIDVDAIVGSMKAAAEKYGSVTMEVPLIGRLKFSADDVETLGRYMM